MNNFYSNQTTMLRISLPILFARICRPMCIPLLFCCLCLVAWAPLYAGDGSLPLAADGFGPDSVYLGRVATGTCDTISVPLRNVAQERVVVEGVDLLAVPTLKLVSPLPGPSVTLEPEAELIVRIAFCPSDTSCLPGRIEVTGYLESLGPVDGRQTHSIALRACGGNPQIELRPSTLDVGTSAIGERIQKSAVLFNIGNSPLRIDSLSVSGPAFDATLSRLPVTTIAPGDSALVTVGFTPIAEGATEGIVTIYGSDPLRPAFPLPVSGLGVERRLSTQDYLDLGRLLSGRCRDSILRIVNASPLPTVITRIEIVDVEINDRARNFSLPDDPAFPVTLAPGETYELRVRYCASSEWDVSGATLWVEQEKGAGTSTRLRGRGRKPFVGASIFSLDFGPVIAGRCVDTVLWLHNGEWEMLSLESVDLDRRYGSGSVQVIEPVGLPLDVKGGDSARVVLRFCPDAEDNVSFWLNAAFDAGKIYPLRISGEGVVPAIWVDTASFEAGQTGELTVHVWPSGALNNSGGSIELDLNPNALFITDVRAAPGSGTNPTFRFSQNSLGHVVIETDDPVRTGEKGEALILTMRGLVTGRPTNEVRIARTTLGDSILRWDTLSGLVNLSGCDIGAFGGTSRSISIGSIQPNPASGSTTILYRAPEGYTASITLYDYRGSIVYREDLPVGTGQIEEYTLRVDQLPHGLYMVEIVDREERRMHPLYVE